jgi:hypothetical protein
MESLKREKKLECWKLVHSMPFRWKQELRILEHLKRGWKLMTRQEPMKHEKSLVHLRQHLKMQELKKHETVSLREDLKMPVRSMGDWKLLMRQESKKLEPKKHERMQVSSRQELRRLAHSMLGWKLPMRLGHWTPFH